MTPLVPRPLVLVLCLAATLASVAVALRPSDRDAAAGIPIQHGGRIKPLDAYARQTLELVSGRERWQRRTALSVVLETIADPQAAHARQWLRIDHPELIAKLGLESGRHYYSIDEVAAGLAVVESLARSAEARRDRQEAVPLVERKAEQLWVSFSTARGLLTGMDLGIAPGLDAGGVWRPLSEESAPAEALREVARSASTDRAASKRQAERLAQELSSRLTEKERRALRLETLYIKLRPYHLAWPLYLMAFVLLIGRRRGPMAISAGAGLALGALSLHTAGLVLRTLILDRPPVSNMYESMVFMNWVLVLAALGFWLVRRTTVPLSAGAITAAVILIYADLLPVDAGLDVLVPVLRSNYWLTLHVLTIVASYGLFGLAMALGHRHLTLRRWGRLTPTESVDSATLQLRCVEIGVFLLGIGTVLGGVWANESWGRFWGWDPKETWALITFLGYLVIVHLHHDKRLSAEALSYSNIAGFLLVLMTWYGVNFVLGKGLHSYGQGSGGLVWVSAYLIVEALFVGWALSGPRRSA
ncbi:MAG: Cytochrome c biogenesis protein CcsA [Candidatus Omnitrophica bacterium]|nr:Cytochrome c biogenesis protein CcsA [Candidatus Omnitrophota bacterium]